MYRSANPDATSDDYGRKRVLKLSDSKQIAGPGQTYNFISTNPLVAEKLLPFNRDGSSASAIYGNLLTLPMGAGLLYAPVRFVLDVGIGQTGRARIVDTAR